MLSVSVLKVMLYINIYHMHVNTVLHFSQSFCYSVFPNNSACLFLRRKMGGEAREN